MNSANAIEKAYALAGERYVELGVEIDRALEELKRVSISLHCWQGDDIGGFETTGGPTFTFNDVNVDGLGRLTDANETITNTGGSGIDHLHIYGYDKLSQLIDANISNIGGGTWTGSYTYKKNGDMIARKINDVTENFGFNGHRMTAADSNSLEWDNNGNLLDLLCSDTNSIEYNWDNKLRSATKGSKSIDVKYDPAGNRIWKNSSEDGTRRYIVDIVGKLPVILMELNSSDATPADISTYTTAWVR